MEDYTKMTAAELMAELRRLADVKAGAAMYAEYPRTSGDPQWAERVVSCDVSIVSIEAELDARCEKYKLRIGATGCFEASEDCFDKLFEGYGRLTIDPAEFIGLGNYILSKTK